MTPLAEMSATAERVLDAAEGLIQQHGYNGFSYEDIARLVGIRKPSIHHHFSTKAELVAVVAHRYSHRFEEQLLAIERRHASAPARLKAYAALFEQTFAQHQRLCLCGMLGAEADSLPDEVADKVAQFFAANLKWLTAVVAAGQRASLIRSRPSSAAIAEAFLCALEGAMVVGRGMPSAKGPAATGAAFLTALMT
jgi:TetR/AcrR family transcriptional repressor of nem operon